MKKSIISFVSFHCETFCLQWSITPLIDNYHNDHHYYIIKVFTGMRHGAGTRSNIGFTLFGEKRDTGARLLFDGVRKVSSLDTTTTTLLSLFDLLSIKLKEGLGRSVFVHLFGQELVTTVNVSYFFYHVSILLYLGLPIISFGGA